MTILAHLRTLAIASIRRLAIKEESMAPCAGALGNVNGPLVVTGIRRASVQVWPNPDGLATTEGCAFWETEINNANDQAVKAAGRGQTQLARQWDECVVDRTVDAQSAGCVVTG